jgi:hypothetical protein
VHLFLPSRLRIPQQYARQRGERELRKKEHATDQALLPQMSQRGAVLVGVVAVGVLSGLCVEGEEQRQGKERCPPIVWFFCRLFR